MRKKQKQTNKKKRVRPKFESIASLNYSSRHPYLLLLVCLALVPEISFLLLLFLFSEKALASPPDFCLERDDLLWLADLLAVDPDPDPVSFSSSPLPFVLGRPPGLNDVA